MTAVDTLTHPEHTTTEEDHLSHRFCRGQAQAWLEGEPATETVEHPDYYGGPDDPYEVIKVAEAWGLDEDAYLFNVLKYIARAGKKNPATRDEDLRKGRFYLDRRINHPKDNT